MAISTIRAGISAGESFTGLIAIDVGSLCGLLIPPEWTEADLTFDVTVDYGRTFVPILAADGTEIRFRPRRSSVLTFDSGVMKWIHMFRLRSGTREAPIIQKDHTNLTLILFR